MQGRNWKQNLLHWVIFSLCFSGKRWVTSVFVVWGCSCLGTREKEVQRQQETLSLLFLFFLFVSEINRVRLQLFHHKGNGRIPLDLPEPIGPVQTISEKLYVPVKEHPDVSIKHYISYLQTSTQSFMWSRPSITIHVPTWPHHYTILYSI